MITKMDRTKRRYLANLGGNIRDRRTGRGLTLRQLAAIADVSLTALWQIEHGKSEAGVYTMERIALALESTIGTLTYRAPKKGGGK